MNHPNSLKRVLSAFLSVALLLSCAVGLVLPANAAETGGISTYLSDFGFAGRRSPSWVTASRPLKIIPADQQQTRRTQPFAITMFITLRLTPVPSV